MPRYIKQRDATSCGPVALINVLKWMGMSVSYSFIDIARHMCNWDRENGTYRSGMFSALQKFQINFYPVYNPTTSQIDEHIDNKGIVVIDDREHYSLCIGHTKHFYRVVNDGQYSKTIKLKSKLRLQRVIDLAVRDKAKCICYFILPNHEDKHEYI
jgi:hypothetical protein